MYAHDALGAILDALFLLKNCLSFEYTEAIVHSTMFTVLH